MKKFGFPLLIIIVFLLLLEAGGRLLGLVERKRFEGIRKRSLYRTEPQLGYSMKPNFKLLLGRNTPVETNSRGWRDREYNWEKGENVFRVICIGDSRTFGLALKVEDTFPKQLERMLKERFPAREIEVINAGVPGYTTREGLILIQQVLPPLKPDLVIASFGHNDRWRSPHRRSEIAAHLGTLPKLYRFGLSTVVKKLDDLFDNFPVYFNFKVRLRGLFRKSKLIPTTPEQEFEFNVPLPAYRENIVQMARSDRQHGISLLFLDFSENPGIFDHADKGKAYLEESRFPEAEEELKRAASIPINFSPAPHFYLGLIYQKQGLKHQAEEQFLIAAFGSRIYPHPLRIVKELFRRRGITHREMTIEELSELMPIKNPYRLIEGYMKVMEEVSHREDVPAVILGKEKMGEDMFFDADHPNAKGCRFLARQVLLSPVWDDLIDR